MNTERCALKRQQRRECEGAAPTRILCTQRKTSDESSTRTTATRSLDQTGEAIQMAAHHLYSVKEAEC